MNAENLSRGQIPVLGAGASGRAVFDLLKNRGLEPILFDEKRGSGRIDFEPAQGTYPFGVISPGFPPDHPWRAAAKQAGMPLLGELEIGLSDFGGRLLCITGTNGKSTLTSLLEKALVLSGDTAKAVGNIGLPISAVAGAAGQPDWAVCEVSSFQLYDWQAPHGEAALWTNFAADHLDWHPTIGDYFKAKWRLVESGMPVFADIEVLRTAEAMGLEIPDNLKSVPYEKAGVPAEGLFSREPFAKLYSLARAWWSDTGRDMDHLERAAVEFEGLPHRMEQVAILDGREFINDSKATNSHAALAACDAVNKPIFWIGGGQSKGEDLANFAKEIAQKIESADLIGGTQEKLGSFLTENGLPVRCHASMEEAVKSATERSSEGSVILLSPGFASFDQFSGYSERGNVFRESVFALPNARESV